MASQYFEFGGIRIDLSKISSFAYTSCGEKKTNLRIVVQESGYGGIDIPDALVESFLAAERAYKESLKPKQKYLDGWYVVDFKDGATSHLRYFKGDVGYHHDGIRSISNVEYYRNRARTDFQPPPPTITD